MGANCCSANPEKYSELQILGKEAIILEHRTLTCSWPSKFLPFRVQPNHTLHILHDYQIGFLRKIGVSKWWRNLSLKDSGNTCAQLGPHFYKLVNVKNLRITLEKNYFEKNKEKHLLKKLVLRNRLETYEIFANTAYSCYIPLREIARQTQLQNLSLFLYNLSASWYNEVTYIPIRRCNKLKKLKLNMHQIETISKRSLATLFYRMGQLADLESLSLYLSLDSNLVKKQTISESYKLLSSLEKLKTLETIIFYDDEEDDAQLNSLCYLLKALPQIQSLNIKILNDDLIDVKIPSAYPALLQEMSSLRNLNSLDLTIHNLLVPKHSVNYAHTITTVEKTCSFTLVVQGENERGSNSKNIFLPLTNIPNLQKFNWSCSIPMNGIIRSLTEFLSNNDRLTNLKLFSNDNSDMSKEDVEKICKSIKSLKNLKHLDIDSFNSTSQEFVNKLLSSISELNRLTSLTLKAEEIMSMRKRAVLYQSLKKLKSLTDLQMMFYDSQVCENPTPFIEVVKCLPKLQFLRIEIQYFDSYLDNILNELSDSISPQIKIGIGVRLANPEPNYLRKIGIMLLKIRKLVDLKLDISMSDTVNHNNWEDMNSITYAISQLNLLDSLEFGMSVGEGELSVLIGYLNQCFPNLRNLRNLRLELAGDIKNKMKEAKSALLQRICPMMRLEEIFIKLNKEIVVQYRKEQF